MLLVALPAGLLIGLTLGVLGAGGSILTIPVLVYLLGQDPHQATTASLIIVGLAAAAGAVVHGRAGRVRFGTGLVFGLLGAAGSYLGSRASAAVDPAVLLLGFAVLLLVAAMAMLPRLRRGRRQPPAPAGMSGTTITVVDRRLVVRTVAAATVVGLLTGFFGVGGGFIVVPALALALGLDTATAVGTSLVVITVNSATALASRVATQPLTLDWPLLAVFVVAAVAGVLAGNRVAGRLNSRQLTIAFVVLLVLVAGYTAATSLPL
ncbi:MAG TPA: sulfite exporter TauE/SafE family protein [Actinophytocola sp.]|uniref:sulfite exporter TauE/SafE family protein n=1 Tax=Actinophytocola sp. TaxID=1872138 RepID=UPI002DBAFC82|nr:sulfite exporter TauE/SafE family protein [Actinophytocola sp.]HEU5474920.1 sulfite exporter TauE/SafE family protein [Actinophytocola sp.]